MFVVDRGTGVPLYRQIKDQVIQDISKGRLVPGTRLPSIRRLAAHLGVTPGTVRHAYAALATEGLVISRQGKGVIVRDLNPADEVAGAPLATDLTALMASAVSQAQALGYSVPEVKAAFVQALSQWGGKPKVMVILPEVEFIEYYTPLLSRLLQDLSVEIVPVLLDADDPRGTAVLESEVPPLCVVTFVRVYSRVRDLFALRQTPVIAMPLVLSDETKEEIFDLPADTRVVLVTEKIHLMGILHLVEQYRAVAGPIAHVPMGAPDLAEMLPSAGVVLHTLRARKTVLRLLPRDCRAIELHFVPDPLAVKRLRESITSRLFEVSRLVGASGLAIPQRLSSDGRTVGRGYE